MTSMTRHLTRVALLGGLAGLLSEASTADEVPHAVAHQGRLLHADGTPINGSRTLSFALFEAAEGGTALWSEVQTLPVASGFFTTLLGVESPLSPDDLDGARYLEVSVDGAALPPRQPLTSVPFALRAEVARDVDGGTVVAEAVSTNALDVAGPVQATNMWSHAYTVSVVASDRVPLQGPDGGTIGEFGGLVSISHSHRDAAGALYHLVYSRSGAYSNGTYASFHELSYRNADGNGKRKYELRMGSDGHPYIQMLREAGHTSWNNATSQAIRVDFMGSAW